MSQSGGRILCEQAYAQGKMLDSSGWQGLPRGITPSDIDLTFDNEGRILFTEFARHHTEWSELNKGQQILYRNIVSGSNGMFMAALAKHSVDAERAIKTSEDVESFQPMFLAGCEAFGKTVYVSKVWAGDMWKSFVRKWFEDPGYVYRRLLQEECEVFGTVKTVQFRQPVAVQKAEPHPLDCFCPDCRGDASIASN